LEFSLACVLIGTSGWSYASWRGPFFPTGLTAKRQLDYYASQFETVELNGVFYRTPTIEAVRRWRDETGQHFVFSWKASKFITHWKRLPQPPLGRMDAPKQFETNLAKAEASKRGEALNLSRS
jgi:uncharacterized protein YecE (DUF72 family)